MRRMFVSSIPWRTIGEWVMRTVWNVAIPIGVALLTTIATNRVQRPTIDLRFEPTIPMLIPAEQRPNYGDDAIAVKIETDATLKNAIVRLLAISKNLDMSQPLNSFVEPSFGWPLGADSFQPRTIGGYDYILIATETKSMDGRKHIKFFFNEFYGVPGSESKPIPELEFLRDLLLGTYYMQLALLSESAAPATQKFKIIWDGKSFEISVLK